MRWPLQPLQPLQKTQLQPPFGPSVDSLCHPCITTTKFSCRFHIFETSAAALCRAAGILLSFIVVPLSVGIAVIWFYGLFMWSTSHCFAELLRSFWSLWAPKHSFWFWICLKMGYPQFQWIGIRASFSQVTWRFAVSHQFLGKFWRGPWVNPVKSC